jgi:hypothetical protein
MSSFGLIEENMELSHIYLAVTKWVKIAGLFYKFFPKTVFCFKLKYRKIVTENVD